MTKLATQRKHGLKSKKSKGSSIQEHEVGWIQIYNLNSKENSTTRVLKQTSIQSPKGKTMYMNQAQTWSLF